MWGSALQTQDPFGFELPPDLIAQSPARPRESARLLAVGAALSDHTVADLPTLLEPGDLLVANDTRVIPAQLTARRGAARVGLTLDRPLDDGTWHALARNARRLAPGDILSLDGTEMRAAVAGREEGSVTLRFDRAGEAFAAALREAGALALPPYIARPAGPTAQDATDYQTVFAREEGAVAAPTGGLHFTPALLAALEMHGVRRTMVTLHVGAGTFLPVRGNPADHHIHPERGEVTEAAAAAIRQAGRVVAVGTTTLRLLESAVTDDGVQPFEGATSLFIRPGFRFRAVHRLMTNFHLPHSTLFMLVCAFAGTERMRAAYAHAIARGYRFYSYGDSSLLYPAATSC